MMESLQLPILAIALVVMSWAVMRLRSTSAASPNAASSYVVPPEVLRWEADLKRLSGELQAELDEKMASVNALSQAYELASKRLGNMIAQAEQLERELASEKRSRISA